MKMLMSQGRGNAIAVSVLLMGMLLRCGNVWAATYTVGDAAGWSFNVVGWPNGKTFRAGDVLVQLQPSIAQCGWCRQTWLRYMHGSMTKISN
ncbi:hypothetical protein RGQ29_005715 [Quercus rubra]|uniref:Phytocyanin domain-containing protein n=1 Tax=Quercus rubra TaxID=3512 RepID=A0AAN7IB90_QUERU|nr:hypothetical protein RGQ29_005715 [Quercus rubra]